MTTNNDLPICPRCAGALQAGFSARASGISFIKPEKFKDFAFLDQDVSGAGLTKFLPSKAAYFRAYLCRACELIIIDYSRTYSRAEANDLAATLS